MRASRSAGGSRPVTASTRTVRTVRPPRPPPNALGEGGAKVSGDVLRGIDEAAEDDRVEPVREKGLHLAHRALELAVVRGVQVVGASGEREQPAARRLPASFRFRAGAEVERHRVVIVALVEHGAPADPRPRPRLPPPRRPRPGSARLRLRAAGLDETQRSSASADQ